MILLLQQHSCVEDNHLTWEPSNPIAKEGFFLLGVNLYCNCSRSEIKERCLDNLGLFDEAVVLLRKIFDACSVSLGSLSKRCLSLSRYTCGSKKSFWMLLLEGRFLSLSLCSLAGIWAMDAEVDHGSDASIRTIRTCCVCGYAQIYHACMFREFHLTLRRNWIIPLVLLRFQSLYNWKRTL